MPRFVSDGAQFPSTTKRSVVACHFGGVDALADGVVIIDVEDMSAPQNVKDVFMCEAHNIRREGLPKPSATSVRRTPTFLHPDWKG